MTPKESTAQDHFLECDTLGFHLQAEMLKPPFIQHNKQYYKNVQVTFTG